MRDARRALARGDTDEALVALWNALEPLRLSGDRRGLRAVGEMAAHVATHGDGSQAREAERLLGEVRDLLQLPPAPEQEVAVHATVGRDRLPPPRAEPPVSSTETEGEWWDGELEPEVEPRRVEAEEDERTGPRFGPLVWALIVAAFVIFNIVSGLLRE